LLGWDTVQGNAISTMRFTVTESSIGQATFGLDSGHPVVFWVRDGAHEGLEIPTLGQAGCVRESEGDVWPSRLEDFLQLSPRFRWE
jgi:hypothetical protein